MRSTTAPRRWLGLACVVACITTAPVHADMFSLGIVTGSRSFTFDNIAHMTPFEDVFMFSITSGSSLSFSGFVNTPWSNWFWIDDLDGRLERDGVTVLEADAQTLPDPFSHREVTFPTHTLTAGDYTLRLFGTPTAMIPDTRSSYDGVFTFAALPPVPEPDTMALMALGLAGVGLLVRRKRLS